MPVKSLESFLFERGLVGAYPLEALKNARLGIDVDHYVSRLLTAKREQYLDAIGGFPTSLKMYLESDMQVFKDFQITPVFVFSGSATSNQLEANAHYTAAAAEAANAALTASNPTVNPSSAAGKSGKEAILAQRNKAWTQWSNLLNNNQSAYIDQPIAPHEPFRYSTAIDTKGFQNDLICYFISQGIAYQVAPYSSWLQLAYLLQNGYIDAIYGPTDCLMLPEVEKFILGMEFPNKEFRFIENSRVLNDFNISQDEFIDICMAVGNDLQPITLPPLQVYPPHQLFEIALEMAVTGGTDFYAYQLVNPLKVDNSDAVKRYQRGVSSLKYMPVLKESGRVELLTENSEREQTGHSNSVTPSDTPHMDTLSKTSSPRPIPNDVHDVISQRLPHEYYFYRSIGLIGGKLLDTIATGVYPEEAPLDGGSANSYRNLVKKSVEFFKNKEINLLTQSINRYYQSKPIKQVNWFSPDDVVVLNNRLTPSVFERINHLVVKTDKLDTSFSLSEFVNLLSNSEDMSKDFISKDVLFPNSVPAKDKLFTPFDLLATNFLRFLYLMEFFEFDFRAKTLKPTKWGEVLLQFNKLGVNPESQEAIFIMLTFLKMGVLSLSEETQPATPSALSKATLRSYPDESIYILVLTRILTLFRLDQKPTNYHGPIDKKTLIFRDHLDFVRENLKETLEAVLVSSLSSGEFDRLSLNNFEWQNKIVFRIPFKLSTPSTIMAMMWEFYLQKYLHNGNAKNDAMALVTTSFSTYKFVPNLEEEFERSKSFLKDFSYVLKALAKLGLVGNDEYELYQNAFAFAERAFS